MLKELQKNAAFRDPTLAAANLAAAQMDAMKNAAKNSGGAAIGFMGMNMAQSAGGIDTNALYAQAAQQQAAQHQAAPAAQPKASAGGWTCPTCGKSDNTGKFCSECGTKKPEDSSWFCPECGHKNTGKFCPECGTPRP